MQSVRIILKPLALSAGAILLLMAYSYGLDYPPEPYFDEVHYVNFIRGLLDRHEYIETANVHPPLWHILTAAVVRITGDSSFAWRIISLLAGMAAFVPLFLLSKRLTANHRIALLSVFFLAFDCISLTQARSAMMNSLMLLFVLTGFYLFLGGLSDIKGVRRKSFVWAGVFIGLALATKLVALNVYLFFVPVLIMEYFKRRKERGALIKNAAVYLLALPILIFIAVHLFIPFFSARSFTDIWGILNFHMGYNLTTDQTHTYSSRWWSWVLMLRPIWFYFQAQNWDTPSAVVSGIICIGNPAVFWMIPVAVYNLFIDFLFKKSRPAGLILLGFFTQWLSFGLLQRLQFFHYFYSVMPFTVMALALLVNQLWERGGFWRPLVAAYIVIVAALFVYWYPLLTGIPVSGSFYGNHIWFKSWI